MATQINVLEAKNRLSQLLKAVQAGEEVVIANRGEPVARLVPVRAQKRKAGKGNAGAILDWLDAHPLPECAHRSAQEIDADIEEARASWDLSTSTPVLSFIWLSVMSDGANQ